MFEVKGLAKLEKKLAKMEKKVARAIVRKAVRKAQNICLRAAKQSAESMVGGEMGSKIAGALKVKSIKKQKKGSYQLQVCIDPQKAEEFKHKTEEGETYYIPTAIEYGHKNRDGSTTAPIAYMRQASDETAQKRIDIMISEIKKGVDSA
jgi:HK97 gp10 family phage protein